MITNFPLQNSTTPGLTINLGENKVLKSFPARNITADKIEIDYIIDYYSQKKVVAFTKSVLGQVTLWEGADYIAVGQWTDDDVTNRIKEILGVN
jgi:hypothetical protein